MRISIAMATFNGDNFLRQQLESFLAQTKLPDELVVCDDGSSDQTLQILESFSREASFAVHVHRNPKNLGHVENFGKALSLCTGEIIFLSDQDDVWFPKKIERVARVFDASEDVLLVINDAEITDKHLQLSGLTQAGQIRGAGLTLDHFVNGSCSALSARLLRIILPIPREALAHDNWIHKLAGAMGVRQVLDEVLQYYRRHDESTSKSIISVNSRVSRWDLARQYARGDAYTAAVKRLSVLERMCDRLDRMREVLDDTKIRTAILDAIKHLKEERKMVSARVYLLKRPLILRIPLAFIFWFRGGYRFFSGWKSLSKDLLT
jgi:glycosyltransferase involved in cell wall biosynthesis